MGAGENKLAGLRQGELLSVVRLKALWAALSTPMRWALGLTLAATAGVLILPSPDAVPDRSTQANAVGEGAGSPTGAADRPGTVWAAWQQRARPEFPEAEADPFSAHAAAPAIVAAPPVVAAPVGPLVPAAPPPPPQTQFRVLGWFGLAGDAPQLLLSDGQTDVVAKAGLALSDGFVVRAIEARGVVLRHPPSQTEVILPLPESLPQRTDAGAAVGAPH